MFRIWDVNISLDAKHLKGRYKGTRFLAAVWTATRTNVDSHEQFMSLAQVDVIVHQVNMLFGFIRISSVLNEDIFLERKFLSYQTYNKAS